MALPTLRSTRRAPAGAGTEPQDRRRPFPPRTAAAAGLTAAALVLSGCGTGGADEGRDGGAQAATAADAKILQQVPMPKVGEMAGAMGMWTTEKNFVKTGLKEIVGYPLGGGKPRWRVPLGGEVCWASQQPTHNGLVAVLFENDKDDPAVCTEVGLVDLDKGKLLWQKQARDAYGSAQMFDEVTIGGGTVAAGGTSGPAGWSLGGTPLWKPSSDATCQDTGYAGDEHKLVAVRDCGDTDHPRLEVRTLDPKTRAVTSAYKLPQGTEYVHVASTDPLVLAADNGDAQGGSGVSEFLAVDDSAARGKLLGKVATTGGKFGKFEAECPSTEAAGCTQLAVSKKAGALFLGTSDPGDPSSDAENDIVAFSLKTGKKIGTTEGVDAGRLIPVGLDEQGRVIAYQESDIMTEQGGAVWRIDPVTFKKTKLLQNPSAGYAMESGFTSDRRMRYAAGRLYLGSDSISEPSEYSKGEQPLAVVLGAK